eukprot:6195078-Pleurochrysis_carterae.AAC.1
MLVVAHARNRATVLTSVHMRPRASTRTRARVRTCACVGTSVRVGQMHARRRDLSLEHSRAACVLTANVWESDGDGGKHEEADPVGWAAGVDPQAREVRLEQRRVLVVAREEELERIHRGARRPRAPVGKERREQELSAEPVR